MKAFNNWFKNIEKDYPKYQDKNGYCIGNTPALKAGWRAALEWAKDKLKCEICPGDIEYFIDKELKEE